MRCVGRLLVWEYVLQVDEPDDHYHCEHPSYCPYACAQNFVFISRFLALVLDHHDQDTNQSQADPNRGVFEHLCVSPLRLRMCLSQRVLSVDCACRCVFSGVYVRFLIRSTPYAIRYNFSIPKVGTWLTSHEAQSEC